MLAVSLSCLITFFLETQFACFFFCFFFGGGGGGAVLPSEMSELNRPVGFSLCLNLDVRLSVS